MLNRPVPLPSGQRHSAQHGVVLVVVLVMLVIIAFMSVSIMRGALTSDLITNNSRTQTLATEMAQLALRYCEDELIKANSTLPILPAASPMAWESKGNWVGTTGGVRTLNNAQLKSANSAFTPGTSPQCLAQYSPDPGTDQIVVLTARGFSPDYAEDAQTHQIANGSVVWLQSRLLLSAAK